MRNIFIILLAIVAVWLVPQRAQAQAVVLKTDTISIPCTSVDTFVIPISALNFNDLGGVQFTLKWNPTEMKYIFLQDFNPLLENGFYNFDTLTFIPSGRMTFSWLDPNGLTIPNSGNNTLFKLAFVRLGGPFSPLQFDTSTAPLPPTAVTVSNSAFQSVPFTTSIGGVQPIDTQLPTITCPANQQLTGTGAIQVPNIPASGVADNCGTPTVGWASSGATMASFPNDPDASNAIFNPGLSTVVYSATDVGGNIRTCSFVVEVISNGPEVLTFRANSGVANCNATYFLDVTTSNFDSLFGAQFSLQWQTAVLRFDSIANLNTTLGLTSGNLNLNFSQNGNQAGTGNLSFGWNSDDFVIGSTLPDGAVLFRIYYTVQGADGATTGINFTNFPADTLSIDPDLQVVPTIYQNGTFEVVDNTAPTVACPQNASVTAVVGQASATVGNLAPTLTDNCSGNIALAYTPATVGSGNGAGAANGTYPGGTTVVTYTATDAAGNTATCSFAVTVDLGDIFELSIDNATLSCNGTPNPTISIPVRVNNFDDIAGMTFRINWDPTVLTYTGFSNPPAPNAIPVSGGMFPQAGTTAPAGFLNFAGSSPSLSWPNIPDGAPVFFLNFNVMNPNATTALYFSEPISAFNGGTLQLVAVDTTSGSFKSVDVTGPVLSNCTSVIVPAGANCQQTVNLNVAATDLCGTVASLTSNAPVNNVYNAGPTVVTFNATDAAGNTSTCSLTVTVNANNNVSFTNCPTQTIVIPATDACSAPISYPTLVASNLCNPNQTIIYNYSVPQGAIRNVGTTTSVTCTANGFTTCTFLVRVVDGAAPSMICPDPVTLTTEEVDCFILTPTVPEPGVSDFCDNNPSISIDPASIDTLFVGGTTLMYTATDNAGNSSTCSFQVFVLDGIAPEIICPTGIAPVQSDPNSCGAAVSWTAVTASDNCSVGVALDGNAGPSGGDLFDIGETTVEFTATDESGNTATCSFIVKVTESIPPTIVNCPTSQFFVLPSNQCDTMVTWLEPQTGDNCGIDTVMVNFESGSIFPSGITTVTYTVVDLAGNTATCSFVISATDLIPPVFTFFPGNITLPMADPCGAQLTIQEPTASDNCDQNPVITYSAPNGTLSGPYPPGETKIEIRVTDASGNLTQDTLTITVIPFPNKSFVNIPADQVLTGCPQVASWTTPTVQGFCEPPVITTDSISGSVFPIGVSVVTFTATETNGATFTATFSITITESEKPIITCPNSVLVSSAGVELSGPSNTIISIASSGTGCQEVDMELKLPTATDNCTDAVTITQTGGPSVNGIFPIGTHTLTFEAKDNAGNTSACSYLVEVLPFDVLTPQVIPNPGCDGATVTISVPAFPGATYTWTGPQQSYPNEPVITILSLGTGNAGQYTVTAKLNGCTAIGDTVNVVLVQKPDAILDSGLTISLGETLDSIPVLANDIFSVANDIQVSQVSPLDGLTLNEDGTFTYVAGNNGGSVSFLYEICSKACPDLCDMAEVTINIRDKECAFVPNIFTPNGDMTNDVLVIPCLGTNAVDNPYPNNTLMIYNQWGAKVFEAKGYTNEAGKAWDGTLNNDGSNKLPDGVYYYIFKPDANAATLKGFVHIYR